MNDIVYWRKSKLGGDPYAPYKSIASGNPKNIAQIDAENLLVYADDLTTWNKDPAVIVTNQGEGVFRIEKTEGGWKHVNQNMHDWIPFSIGVSSIFFEARAGTIDNGVFNLRHNDPSNTSIITDVEKISGAGSIAPSSGQAVVTGLDGNWSKFRATGTYKGKLAGGTDASLFIWAGGGNPEIGYIEVRNMQVVQGNVQKTRPHGTPKWMMAWRPHNREFADHSGSYAVVDSMNMIYIDSKPVAMYQNPGSSAVASPADFGIDFFFTAHLGQSFTSHARYVDANNYGAKVWVDGTGALAVYTQIAGGGDVLVATKTGLIDGEYYHLRIQASGSVGSVLLDDEALTMSSQFDVLVTQTNGDVVSTMANLKIVSSPLPYRTQSEIILPGGLEVASYNDPLVTIANPSGELFAVHQGSALAVTATPFYSTGLSAYFGFGNSLTAGFASYNFCRFLSNELRYRSNVGYETIKAPALPGDETSTLMLVRSDSGGVQILSHESGRNWRRSVVDKDELSYFKSNVTKSPQLMPFNGGMSVKHFVLVDCTARHSQEFRHVSSSIVNPDPIAYFDIPHDYHSKLWGTHQNADLYYDMRYVSSANMLEIWIQGNGGIRLYEKIDNVTTQIGDAPGAITPLSAFVMDVVGYKQNIYVFINKALVITAVHSANNQDEGGRISYSTYVTPDISFENHPYPALGGHLGATALVICPQQGNTFEAESDVLSITRNLTLATSGNSSVALRQDVTPPVETFHYTDGSLATWEATDQRLFLAAGIFVGGDEQIALNGSALEVFEDGTSKGSSNNIVNTTGVGGIFLSPDDAKADQLEVWPLFADFIDPAT